MSTKSDERAAAAASLSKHVRGVPRVRASCGLD